MPMAAGASRKPLNPGCIGLTGDDLPSIGAAPAATRFDLRTWWPVDRRRLPFEMEIGCGKGTFLVQQVARTPGVNYLGIEWSRQYWRHAADRLRRHGFAQVRLLHADAGQFVQWYCPDGLFRQVHIYFPDPWPKARHHKRRLIQSPFLIELHRVLDADGHVRIVTDHDDYFAWVQQHLAPVADRFERLPFERPVSAGGGEIVGTNFERKYRREGRPFHALTLKKR
jgi:tRNA (guanine-N7-)-methyltransferase